MSSIQGSIFGDSIPELGEEVGYRTSVVAKTTGLTPRQIDNWITKGYFEPSLKNEGGSGNRRLFTFKDIVILKTYKELIDAGVTPGKLAKAKDLLKDAGVDDLSLVTLFSDGKNIFLANDNNEIINILQNGQGVFAVSVAAQWQKTEGELHEFKPLTPEEEVTPPALLQLMYNQKENINLQRRYN